MTNNADNANNLDNTDNTHDVFELYAYRNKSKGLYYSNLEEQYIVNAVTGEKYPWKVGTLDEQRLFKVKDTTMSCLNYSGRISQTAYYKDPYQYMIHNNVHLPNSLIDGWKKRVEELTSCFN